MLGYTIREGKRCYLGYMNERCLEKGDVREGFIGEESVLCKVLG